MPFKPYVVVIGSPLIVNKPLLDIIAILVIASEQVKVPVCVLVEFLLKKELPVLSLILLLGRPLKLFLSCFIV